LPLAGPGPNTLVAHEHDPSVPPSDGQPLGILCTW
jgi:hypothetical protein